MVVSRATSVTHGRWTEGLILFVFALFKSTTADDTRQTTLETDSQAATMGRLELPDNPARPGR
jgi:hypothetical protein